MEAILLGWVGNMNTAGRKTITPGPAGGLEKRSSLYQNVVYIWTKTI